MIVQLPKLERIYNKTSGKVVTKKTTLEVKVITSFKAHLMWEQHFQAVKDGIDLATYSARILSLIKKNPKDLSNATDLMRILYCYIDASSLPSFNEFVDLLEPETTEEIVRTLTTILEEVGKSASKN